ncbi:2-dehydro-3-deoxygalactonokinase [Ostreiculturibacter nitratireducens]|uniref:2-dehydro-3-deoxygalactonokinase n=1 Tax=Ostreiculturibacter nitratireducens TaxID=3075226 RepID=UPI0031B626FE
MTRADWIAADWGTTNLRLWAMSAEGRVLHEAQSDDGMGRLKREEFEPALLRLAGDWLAPDRVTQVFACGMVGARQGWVEAPYRSVPCAPTTPGGFVEAPTHDPRVRVHILPGLSQSSPADVMRGEETQIAGLLANEPGFDGVICLPGTHSKWVRVSAGEVVSFQTFMTGELFALLSTQSVLRHGIAGDGWDEGAFLDALSDTISRPERMAAKLFSLRAEGLLHGLSPETARARLSGLLIGAELSGAKPYWLGQEIAIIGAEAVSAAYGAALRAQGAAPRLVPAGRLTLTGLVTAHAAKRSQT